MHLILLNHSPSTLSNPIYRYQRESGRDTEEIEEGEYEENEMERREMGYYNTSREISRTREELGYLNLLDDSD